MNHLHHTNYHASTLSEMQRSISLLSASVQELKSAQNSPVNVANLEGLINTLKSKVDILSANMSVLEGRIPQHDSKIGNVESRLSFLESREPKLPPNLESALQLKLEHYMTKCVKERIDMLNIPGLKVQLEEKIAALTSQVQTLAVTPAPPPPVSAPLLPLPLPTSAPLLPPPASTPLLPPPASTPLLPLPTSAPQLSPEIEAIVSDTPSSNEDIDISFKSRRQVRKPKM
jgi:hypothetical protein